MDEKVISLAECLGQRLADRGEILVTAESLTGGLISAVITSVPGSSEWFERGYVTYTNTAKHEVLDVPLTVLEKFSAVSSQTVVRMLQGALEHSHATVAVAVSGIAGPTGEMPGKPVGTVFIGRMRRDEMAEVIRCQFEGDRTAVRAQTVETALRYLKELFE